MEGKDECETGRYERLKDRVMDEESVESTKELSESNDDDLLRQYGSHIKA